jgi:hypothetical protein
MFVEYAWLLPLKTFAGGDHRSGQRDDFLACHSVTNTSGQERSQLYFAVTAGSYITNDRAKLVSGQAVTKQFRPDVTKRLYSFKVGDTDRTRYVTSEQSPGNI